MDTPISELFCGGHLEGTFYWSTEYYHPDNTFTMDEFLTKYLPKDAAVTFLDGTYAEVQYRGVYYNLHAGGNGDSFNHVVTWELLL